MAVFVNIDGFPTEIFPIVDELGVIVMDGDAELYNTADGRKVRVMCTSGSPGTVDAPPACPTRELHEQPTRLTQVHEQATQRAPEEALWSTRRTKFLIDKYKEHFRSIGKKAGLRNKKQLFLLLTDMLNEEFECCMSVVQVTNKWKSLERAYKRTRDNNKKSGSAALECSFEEDLSEFMEKQHHMNPVVTFTQGRRIVPDKDREPEAAPQGSSDTTSAEDSSEVQESDKEVGQEGQSRRPKEPPLLQLLKKLDDIEKNRAARHSEKMALLERFVSAYEKRK
ncbi:hypothetical protein HPB50_021484 [Hyalomma asiaticum]|uniref:Uncharacterized protein n=1 Tax=Hyalomma asiaticum TaxID=266040 RepID=A0ACB7SJD6_HYAAI|nr:hypothetical protein HPB50_021484 [Hyalomma asiaticum]